MENSELEPAATIKEIIWEDGAGKLVFEKESPEGLHKGAKIHTSHDIIQNIRREADRRIERIAKNCDGNCSSIEKDVPEIRGYEIKGFACWNRADAINEFAQNLKSAVKRSKNEDE